MSRRVSEAVSRCDTPDEATRNRRCGQPAVLMTPLGAYLCADCAEREARAQAQVAASKVASS